LKTASLSDKRYIFLNRNFEYSKASSLSGSDVAYEEVHSSQIKDEILYEVNGRKLDCLIPTVNLLRTESDCMHMGAWNIRHWRRRFD